MHGRVIALVLAALVAAPAVRADASTVPTFPRDPDRALLTWARPAMFTVGSVDAGFTAPAPLGWPGEVTYPDEVLSIGDRLLVMSSQIAPVVSLDKYPDFGVTSVTANVVDAAGRLIARNKIVRASGRGIRSGGTVRLHNGAIVFVWTLEDGSRFIRRSPAGGWGRVHALGPPGFFLDGWVDGGDGLIAVGRVGPDPVAVHDGRVRRLTGPRGRRPHGLAVTADPRGGAFITYAAARRRYVARLSLSGRLRARTVLGRDRGGVRIAVTPNGRAFVTWNSANGRMLTVFDHSGRLVRSHPFTATGRLVIGPRGRIVVLADQIVAGRVNRYIAFGTAGGHLGPPHPLGRESGINSGGPGVAFDAAERAVVFWSEGDLRSPWTLYAQRWSDGILDPEQLVATADWPASRP